MDVIWFYLDYNGTNGTVYNHRYIEAGKNGIIKPILLKGGDVFVFGGGKKEVINSKTAWGLFLERNYESEWSVIDSAGYKKLNFSPGNSEQVYIEPEKGKVIEMEGGIAIYMGNLTYINGDMRVTGI